VGYTISEAGQQTEACFLTYLLYCTSFVETSLQPAHFPPLPTSASASPDEGHQPTQSQSSSSFSYADMLKVQQSR
jgi:hypothetical protein